MSQHDTALPPGTRIADYEIREVLGDPGSFGITYRATDLHLQRDVALKEYFPADYAMRRGEAVVARDDKKQATFDWGLERFSEEARMLAQFDHRNIVKVLRLISGVNGTAFIVMELIRGRTLESMVERDGPMGAAAFNPIFSQLLDGCAAIHKIGILHRDIKPSNVLVTEAGVPILIDFGSARGLDLQKKAGFTAIVTDTYSPPEQYSREQPQGPWTDVYALAATAYYCLCGGPPPPSTARAVGDAHTPAEQAGAACGASPKMLKGLDWGLTLKAADRPQSIEDWRPSLDLDPKPQAAAAGAATPIRLDRRGVIALAGGAVLLGGVGAVMAITNMGKGGGGRVLDNGSAPLKVAWTKPLGAVDGDPWAALAVTPKGAMLAARRLAADGAPRMYAVQVADDGRVLGEWTADGSASAAQAILPMADGGALVGGDAGGVATLVRLGPDWRALWTRNYGEGEVRSLVAGRDGGVIAAIGTGFDAGKAKLVFLDANGGSKGEVSLLDRPDDSVERVASLPDGALVVLGSRVTREGEKNTTQLFVTRLKPDYHDLWRQWADVPGTTRGWSLAVAGDDVFVVGTSSSGLKGDPTHLFRMRLQGADGKILWQQVEQAVLNGTGRALAAVMGGDRPRLYLSGTGGSPVAHARLAQLADDGRILWSLEAPPQPGARAEGAVALAFHKPGDGYAAGFSFDGSRTQLMLTRLVAG